MKSVLKIIIFLVIVFAFVEFVNTSKWIWFVLALLCLIADFIIDELQFWKLFGNMKKNVCKFLDKKEK